MRGVLSTVRACARNAAGLGGVTTRRREACRRSSWAWQRRPGADRQEVAELVVCSLEPWDEIWRRNQFFVDALLRRNPALRVLFVEPPADVLFDIPSVGDPNCRAFAGSLPTVGCMAFRPLKALPRRLGPPADALLLWQLRACRSPNRLRAPGALDQRRDLCAADRADRLAVALRRHRRLAPRTARRPRARAPPPPGRAGCWHGRRGRRLLAGARNEPRRNASGHARPQRRRLDALPAATTATRRPAEAPTAVYVGTLHDARLDVELVAELADALPQTATSSWSAPTRSAPNRSAAARVRRACLCSAPRPYNDVPAYLQHADVLIVPHASRRSPTALDPIKAYECLAVDTPTVATPIAGFRTHADALNVVNRDEFPAMVRAVLNNSTAPADRRRCDCLVASPCGRVRVDPRPRLGFRRSRPVATAKDESSRSAAGPRPPTSMVRTERPTD